MLVFVFQFNISVLGQKNITDRFGFRLLLWDKSFSFCKRYMLNNASQTKGGKLT